MNRTEERTWGKKNTIKKVWWKKSALDSGSWEKFPTSPCLKQNLTNHYCLSGCLQATETTWKKKQMSLRIPQIGELEKIGGHLKNLYIKCRLRSHQHKLTQFFVLNSAS